MKPTPSPWGDGVLIEFGSAYRQRYPKFHPGYPFDDDRDIDFPSRVPWYLLDSETPEAQVYQNREAWRGTMAPYIIMGGKEATGKDKVSGKEAVKATFGSAFLLSPVLKVCIARSLSFLLSSHPALLGSLIGFQIAKYLKVNGG